MLIPGSQSGESRIHPPHSSSKVFDVNQDSLDTLISQDAPPTGNQSDDETEAPGKQNQPETVRGKHQLDVDQLTWGRGASEMYRSRPPKVSSFSLQRMTCQICWFGTASY